MSRRDCCQWVVDRGVDWAVSGCDIASGRTRLVPTRILFLQIVSESEENRSIRQRAVTIVIRGRSLVPIWPGSTLTLLFGPTLEIGATVGPLQLQLSSWNRVYSDRVTLNFNFCFLRSNDLIGTRKRESERERERERKFRRFSVAEWTFKSGSRVTFKRSEV